MDSLNRHEDYGQEALHETHLMADPIEQFKDWLREAEVADIYEPNAFVLGTVDEEHRSRTRTVLLKGVDERGFFFATNYLSRKGEAVATNPNVSAAFGWYSMYRQVLIQGVAEKVAAVESDAYFGSRPHESQVAAWSSHQSQPIENRVALDEQFNHALAKFEARMCRGPNIGVATESFQRASSSGRGGRIECMIESSSFATLAMMVRLPNGRFNAFSHNFR
jgi:pyridoxamine 5'-phosphate oxidase